LALFSAAFSIYCISAYDFSAAFRCSVVIVLSQFYSFLISATVVIEPVTFV
jgi:hypothetical protein